MDSILSRSSLPVLEQFVWSRLLVAFDFDGTLAPIVRDPSSARLRRSTARLARRLAELFPCAVVSSRPARDVQARLAGLGHWTVWSGGARVSDEILVRIREWKRLLQALTPGFPGVELEDKTSRLTLHYRRSRMKKQVVQAVQAAAPALAGARLVFGKQVIHVQPIEVPDKSAALDEVLAERGCDTALYIGDDETDEDVFSRDESSRLLTVRVGHSPRSRARYFVPDQRCVDELLGRLIASREAVGQRICVPALAPPHGTVEPMAQLLASIRELDHQREVRSRMLEDVLGVTAQQLAVIRLVGRYPGIAPGQIAEMMRVDPSALSPILKWLVAHGLLDRTIDSVNLRRHRLGLTARGRRLDAPVGGTIETALERTITRTPAADLRAAQSVLHALARAMSE